MWIEKKFKRISKKLQQYNKRIVCLHHWREQIILNMFSTYVNKVYSLIILWFFFWEFIDIELKLTTNTIVYTLVLNLEDIWQDFLNVLWSKNYKSLLSIQRRQKQRIFYWWNSYKNKI